MTNRTTADQEPDRATLADGLFFVVGAPRSGTTLVQAMLAAHPRLFIPPETEFFMKFEPPARADLWEEYLDSLFTSRAWIDQGLDADEFRARAGETDRSAPAVFLELMAMHARRTGKPRGGEKSPHHCRCVDRIASVFPEARFIHVIRDPRDVVASRLQTPWSHASHAHHARSWVRTMRDHERLAEAMPSDRYTGLRFESLVEAPERELRSLCTFLDEPFDPAMLEFHRRGDRGFSEREAEWKGNTTRPLDAGAIGRFRSRLSPRQIEGVQRIAHAGMMRYDYEPLDLPRRATWSALDAAERLQEQVSKLRRSVHKRLSPGRQRTLRNRPAR